MAPPVNVGQVLAGKFQIERVLGMGGMGVVVAARHLQLEERVAIKFVQPDALRDPIIVTRFLREAKAAAKIRSEHVARMFDVDTLEDGTPYLVMEYLEGSDLAEVVKQRGPLPVAAAVDYVLQACEAIAEAHAAGIIHRDLKPSNLFVTARADGSHVVKVIDFGISKVATGADAGMDITKTAEMRGSLLFMPPEQMSRPRDVDPRCDIWALGVSLYNLLTGTYPFRAETVPHLCALILNEEPIPPRAYRAEVPAALEAAILQCLRKNPAQRFANVATLAAALVEFGTPASRISAERIAGTLRASAERKTQRSAPALDIGTGAAASPGPMLPNRDFAVEPPNRASETYAPVAVGAAVKDTLPLPTSPSASSPDPAQTARSVWGTTKPVRDSDASSRKRAVLMGLLSALAIAVVLIAIVAAWPRPTTVASDMPTTGAAAPPAALPEEQPPPRVEPTLAPLVSAPETAAPAEASAARPAPPTSSSATGPEVPTSMTSGGGVKASGGAKRGSTAAPAPSPAPGPAGTKSPKKSINDMFNKPN
jgi:serine/threonine-protein kinase